jgi:hypothetical protein
MNSEGLFPLGPPSPDHMMAPNRARGVSVFPGRAAELLRRFHVQGDGAGRGVYLGERPRR